MSSAHDVFISFSFKDQKTAEEIVNELLTKYGITSWICSRELDGGNRFKALIPDAIRAADAVVFIQSESSLVSREIPKEIGIAFDEGKTIIPFRLDNSSLKGVEIEYDLYGTQYIDGTVPTMEDRIRDLARSISRARGKKSGSGSLRFGVPKTNLPSGSGIFAGRDGAMRDIDSALAESGAVFLCGMGGIGKSELAVQYANRKMRGGEYDTAVYARYESSLASLIASDAVFDISGTARKVCENGSPESDEEYARQKIRVLKSSADERTLIILDNFDTPAGDEELFDELVSGAPYRVIVTSRCEPDRKKYRAIKVGELDDEVLKELFIEYADSPNKTDITPDDRDFPELFRMTGRHTQTLELIARYMMESEDIFCLDEMVGLLRENGFGAVCADGFESVRRIFRLSSLSEREKYFLCALAMMPQAGVNQRQFKKWLGDAFSARSRLADRSLVKINGEARSIYLHPVVRDVVISELSPSYSACREFADRCAMVGEDAIPLMWAMTGEEKLAYFACLKSLLSFIPEITRENRALFCNASHMYNYVGSGAEAEELHEKIYSFMCREYGEESREAMLALGRRAWKRSNLRLYRDALPLYRKCADYFIKNPDYTSREAQSELQNCGSVCLHLYEECGGREYLDAARHYYDRFAEYGRHMTAGGNADKAWEANIRYQNECIARDYSKLYLIEGNRAEAEKCLEKYRTAVEEFEKKTGTATADGGDCLERLGRMRYADGKYAEALALYENALGVFEKFFDENNPKIILLFEELSACRTALGECDEAEKCLAEAVRRAEHTFTAAHPSLLRLKKLAEDAKSASRSEAAGYKI